MKEKGDIGLKSIIVKALSTVSEMSYEATIIILDFFTEYIEDS